MNSLVDVYLSALESVATDVFDCVAFKPVKLIAIDELTWLDRH